MKPGGEQGRLQGSILSSAAREKFLTVKVSVSDISATKMMQECGNEYKVPN